MDSDFSYILQFTSDQRFIYYDFWEWLKSWDNELHYMGWIDRVAMLVDLATIETIDKQTQRTLKCKWQCKKQRNDLAKRAK